MFTKTQNLFKTNFSKEKKKCIYLFFRQNKYTKKNNRRIRRSQYHSAKRQFMTPAAARRRREAGSSSSSSSISSEPSESEAPAGRGITRGAPRGNGARRLLGRRASPGLGIRPWAPLNSIAAAEISADRAERTLREAGCLLRDPSITGSATAEFSSGPMISTSGLDRPEELGRTTSV